MPTETVMQQVWIWSLVLYFVVIMVVAVLLMLILQTAKHIHGGVSAIWTTGQKIANNTIHIPLLGRTNVVVTGILESAVRTAGAVAAVEQHAAGCPGCPACVIDDRRERG